MRVRKDSLTVHELGAKEALKQNLKNVYKGWLGPVTVSNTPYIEVCLAGSSLWKEHGNIPMHVCATLGEL